MFALFSLRRETIWRYVFLSLACFSTPAHLPSFMFIFFNVIIIGGIGVVVCVLCISCD